MKIRVFISFVCLFVFGMATSQSITVDALDKKSRKKYAKALKCLKKGDIEKGIAGLQTIVDNNPDFTEGAEKLSGLYISAGQDEKAIPLMRHLAQGDGPMSPALAMTLARALERNKEFDEGISAVEKALANPEMKPAFRDSLELRLEELKFRKVGYANPVKFIPEKLSPAVNTEAMEYHPAFIADGSQIYFVKVRGEGRYRNEDIYMAKVLDGQAVGKAMPIAEVNTDGQEGTFCLSQDGRIMIFTSCERRDAIGGCDLYITVKKGNHWTEPQNMGASINSRWWDSTPSLAADNRTLYFSSRRPGGEGGSDIWMTKLNKHNRWETPVNLGPTVNTKNNDEGPYIHPDSKSLYFISDGHLGFGSYDIFISRKDDDNKWKTPVNLGYPINTPAREGGLFVNLRGDKAYYSSQLQFDEGQQGGDIYSFDLPLQLRPDLVTYINVEVRDAQTKGLIIARTEFLDLLNEKETVVLDTDVSGKLLTTVKLGEYAMNVSKAGYLFHSENIEVNSVMSMEKPFSYKVYLEPIPPKEEPSIPEAKAPKIILKNIFFETGSAELLSKSEGEINTLAKLLRDNPDMRIKILGHTDNVGNDRDNQRLSEQRAKAVQDALIAKGITKDRLRHEGKGETNPVADNTTEEGRRSNRRTEFFIIR